MNVKEIKFFNIKIFIIFKDLFIIKFKSVKSEK
jgi:hypothetical protein